MLQLTDPRLMAGRIKPGASPHGSRPSFGDGCRFTNRRMVWRQLNKRTTRRPRDPVMNSTRAELPTRGWAPGGTTLLLLCGLAHHRLPSRGSMTTKTFRRARGVPGGGARLGAGHELQRGRDGLKDVCEARFGVCIEYGLPKSWQLDRHATDRAADHARSRNRYLPRLALPGANLEEQTAICSSAMVTPDLPWLSLCGHSCSQAERAA